MTEYEKLLIDFEALGISVDSPDFYDHLNFIATEKC